MKQVACAWVWGLMLGLSAGLAGCAGRSQGAAAGAGLDDATLVQSVQAALAHEGTLRESLIRVESQQGEVRLSGRAHTPTDLSRAGEIARGVHGVRAVRNTLSVP